jgi:alpha-L-fucosidase 2
MIKRKTLGTIVATVFSLCGFCQERQPLTSETTASAWSDGRFQVDVPSVVGRSDIVLQRPNSDPKEAMPLGNGRLGLGVWSQDGYTAQLNREDTWPLRLSPGQVSIPGLKKLIEASDYSGRLNLHNGEFEEHGAGITATTYVDEAEDVMVVDVKGADANQPQTAELKLWPGRNPTVTASDQLGVIAETWRDTNEMGASGLMFGSLSAMRIDGREVHASLDGSLAVKITFRPKSDGTFRVLVAAPEWRGGDALGTASALLNKALLLTSEDHRKWWHSFWALAALLKLSSPDHHAEYFENLRMIDLFTTAAESRDRFPGSQAGVGDLFSSFGDSHHWGPSAYWHWNLRMQVSANLGAGLAQFNEPYFNLYNDNMDAIAHWTREHMNGLPGICVPETMRFNGAGYETEAWLKADGINCTAYGRPYYNARTISTGAEIALWVWQQYLYTDDLSFLESHYPLMRNAAQFLLAYTHRDSDGTLYTYPSNAHESNWDVRNPTTDVAAMHTLFPVLIQAAATLGREDETVEAVQKALPHLPDFPLVMPGENKLLSKSEHDRSGAVIANSYYPDAIAHNEENIGLEPVWPYSLIGDDGPLHAIGVNTYMRRPNKSAADWSADPVQAARLGLSDEMKSALEAITERYQLYPSGLAQLYGPPEFYVEQVGVVADALQNGLVQDYDGLVRILPAWPRDWDADGTVVVRHGQRIHLQIRQGKIITLGVEAVKTADIEIRNPWPGQAVDMISEDRTTTSVTPNADGILICKLQAGRSYRLSPEREYGSNLKHAAVSGAASSSPKILGTRTIGLNAR